MLLVWNQPSVLPTSICLSISGISGTGSFPSACGLTGVFFLAGRRLATLLARRVVLVDLIRRSGPKGIIMPGSIPGNMPIGSVRMFLALAAAARFVDKRVVCFFG